MKILNIGLILAFIFLIYNPCKGSNDTLIIQVPKFKVQEKFRSLYFYKVRDTINTTKFKSQFSLQERTDAITSIKKSNFAIFIDSKSRVIESGSWDYENFNGTYKSYYKNGNLKLEGIYLYGQKINEWTYYKKSGVIKFKRNYSK